MRIPTIGVYAVILCMMILAACSPAESDDLPTRAQLPDPTETPVTIAENATGTPDGEEVRDATLPPTFTPTDTPTITPSMTITDTPTPTMTPTFTPSATFTPSPVPTIAPEERPLLGLLEEAARATVLPGSFISQATPVSGSGITIVGGTVPAQITQPAQSVAPAVNCPFFPPGGFGAVFNNNPDIARQLGCPQGNPPNVVTRSGAHQPFERGLMLWIEPDIYVLYSATNSFFRYDDTFTAGVDPENGAEQPPAGFASPVRGFLKVWANNPPVRNGLGWALSNEIGAQATVQRFDNGFMVWFANRGDVLVFITSDGVTGSWRAFAGTF